MATAPPEVPQHEESDYLDPKWRAVSAGLTLVRWGVLVALIGFFLVGGVRLWAAAHAADALERGGPEIYGEIATLFCGLAEFAVLVVATALVLIGRASCRRLPRETKLRGLVSASVWLTLFASLSYGVLRLLAEFRPQSRLSWDFLAFALVVLLGYGLFGLAGELVFLRFLSRVGQQARSLDLVGAVRTFTVLLVAAVVGGVVLGGGLAGAAALLGPFPPPGGPTPVPGRMLPGTAGAMEPSDWLTGLTLLSGLAAAVVGLLLALAYLNLLRLARETIDDRLPEPAAALPEPVSHHVRHV
jgi:hypothetical protein